MPRCTNGCAAGRSQRRTWRSCGSGRLTQPAVGCPALTCRKIAEPRPGTTGAALNSIDREVAVLRRDAPQRLAAAAERAAARRTRRGGTCCTSASAGPRPTSRRRRAGGSANRARPGRRRCRTSCAPRRYVPVGVAPSPSRLCADMPLRPSHARHGPATRRQQRAAALPELERRGCRAEAGRHGDELRRARGPRQARCTSAQRPARGDRQLPSSPHGCGPGCHAAAVRRAGRARDRARSPLVMAPGLPRRPVAAPPHSAPLRRIRRPARTSGQIIVNAARRRPRRRSLPALYGARFPIRTIRPIDVFHGSDSRSTAADNTSSFNCRYAVAPGPKSWSMHAYGEAIDVDTVENPYIQNGRVTPANAKAYADRANVRPGMAVEGGVLVRASPRRLGVGRTLEPVARLPALLDERRS